MHVMRHKWQLIVLGESSHFPRTTCFISYSKIQQYLKFLYIYNLHIWLFLYILKKTSKVKHPRFYLSLSSSSILIFHCLSHPHELLTWRSPPRSYLSLSSSPFFTPLYSHITSLHISLSLSFSISFSSQTKSSLTFFYPILHVSYSALTIEFSLDYRLYPFLYIILNCHNHVKIFYPHPSNHGFIFKDQSSTATTKTFSKWCYWQA